VASLAFLVWLADRGQHDYVTVRLDDLHTGGALDRTLEEDWTCRVLADKHGLARQAVQARGEAHPRRDQGDRARDEALTSLGMPDGAG
jgi:hypothetical protein